MEEADVENEPEVDNGPRFEIVEGASQRGKSMLFDRHGYGFTVKKQGTRVTTRWCSVRNKIQRCPARVTQKSNAFKVGRLGHCHPATPGILTASKVALHAKKEGNNDIFKSAAKLVQDAMTTNIDSSAPCPSLSDPAFLVRRVNRNRQSLRPMEPVTLDFEVSQLNTAT